MSRLDASYSLSYSALLRSLEAFESCHTLSSNWVKDIKQRSDTEYSPETLRRSVAGFSPLSCACHDCWHLIPPTFCKRRALFWECAVSGQGLKAGRGASRQRDADQLPKESARCIPWWTAAAANCRGMAASVRNGPLLARVKIHTAAPERACTPTWGIKE